ncbi:MAG: lytic transglycosylase domain-containing protein [Lentisphaeria bacterium]|nr:lytic transglycosylase domain-containing protein [Lentisphaeria bacterium]
MLLAFILAAFWFREELRDFVVDDTRFAKEIGAAARRNGLDPQLVRAVVFQESRFDPFVRGRAGEVGLMQVLPSGAAAEWSRLNGRKAPDANALYDPAVNLEIGCWYLAYGMRKYAAYRNATELALARYNAGESRSEKWKPSRRDGGVIERITIPGTKSYVTRIMKRYRKYKAEEEKPR